ncbi:MAG: 5'-nucleotidase C-terminal domain-containing protein, partial [Gemmatimonadales bacterium]
GQVVVVDAGDVIEGDPLASYYSRVAPRDPHPMIDAMNTIRYDAATPGDHEFDFGLAIMNRALAVANFPYVSGNLRVPPRDTLAFPAYTVVQRSGIRVGIAGFTTSGVMVWSRGRVSGKIRVARIEESVAPVLREMRRDADFAIVLMHGGLGGGSSYDTSGVGLENSAVALSTGEWRPDLVVVGHSHREMADSVLNGVHFVQPRPFAQALSVVHVDLARQGREWRPLQIEGQVVPLATVSPSPVLVRRLAEAHNGVLAWMMQTIGHADGRMPAAAARVEDTPIIQFINSAQRARTRADLSATTAFDLRAAFEEGEIRVGQAVALYPNDYTLKAIRISGDQLKAYLEQSARYFFVDSTGRVAVNAYVSGLDFDIVSGAEYLLDLSRPPGDRIRELKARGKSVQPTDSFTMAINSYRQTGAGGFAMLRGAPVVYDRGENIADLLMAAVRARSPIRPEDYAQPGWRIGPEAAARSARALFVRAQPPPPPPPPPAPVAIAPPRVSPAAADSLDRAARRADSLRREVIATIKLPMVRRGSQYPLGSLTADAYRNLLRADLAIVSNEEIESDLPAGPLTRAEADSVQPTAFTLRRITMTGADLQWVFEHLVEKAEPCCHLSGAVVTYSPKQPQYHRVKQVRFPDGRRLDRKHNYTLAISDRLVSEGRAFVLGASDCSAPFGCARAGFLGRWLVENSDISSREAVLAYLRRLPQPVAPPEDARIVAAK